MRNARRSALMLASTLIVLASTAKAADGIKATATASRDVPADVLVVTFQITEAAAPAEGDGNQQTTLAKALEKEGFKVLERSARYLPNVIVGGYGASQFNAISSTGAARAPVAIRKQVAFRISGFKAVDDVLNLIGRHGVRQQVTLTVDHSRAEAVAQELQKEAVGNAISQARNLAAYAGVKTSGIVDLATQLGSTAFGSPTAAYAYTLAVMQGKGTNQDLIGSLQPGELPRVRLSVTANVVLGIRPN